MKIRNCLGARMEERQIDRLLDLLYNLEDLSASETADIAALLA